MIHSPAEFRSFGKVFTICRYTIPTIVQFFTVLRYFWEDSVKNERCPVNVYKTYMKRRPQQMLQPDSSFYLAVNYKKSQDDLVWFKCSPLGVNSISSLIKTGCEAAGIHGHKTNHSLRKTTVKRALDAGCPREYVAQVTGHKSVKSLDNYAEVDITTHRAISSCITSGTSFSSSLERPSTSVPSSSLPSPFTLNITGCNSVTIINNHWMFKEPMLKWMADNVMCHKWLLWFCSFSS